MAVWMSGWVLYHIMKKYAEEYGVMEIPLRSAGVPGKARDNYGP